jgi:cytochrome P450
VHYHPESPYGPYWSVTRHADIMTVELDPATYSSASANGGIQIADQPQGEELPNFIRMDPPRHTAQRRTVAPIVAPTNLANLAATNDHRTQALLVGLQPN